MTRTVSSNIDCSLFVTLDGKRLVPECLSRFSIGTRVNIVATSTGYAVKAIDSDTLSVFDAERWVVAQA